MAETAFKTYLHNQAGFRDKWNGYLASSPDFGLQHKLDVLTPFHGTPHEAHLSESQKNHLFLNHVRLMAECLVIFEQVLLFSYYTTRGKPELRAQEFSRPFEQFTLEELYHSMGFRHFLSIHDVFKNARPFIVDATWLKNGFALIVRKFPGALYICSPRLEALSLAYYNEIQRAYGAKAQNSWLTLNKYHHQDEIYHIPLNYHFHDSFVGKNGLLRTLLGSVFFFLHIQVMLITVSFAVINQTFPEKGLLPRVLWTLRYMMWALKVSEAHREARTIMKRHYQKSKPAYSTIFSFLIK